MRARIFQPARTAMSSGTARTRHWVLEFSAREARRVDPLMGWTSSDDTQTQVRLSFETEDEAAAYASAHGIDAVTQKPNRRELNVRPRGYGENFATDRKTVWTH